VAVPTTVRTAALLFLVLPALRAALGFIGKSFGREELLFSGSEGKVGPAIGTED